MNDVRLELRPLGQVLCVPRGGGLQDALFAQGVEFPCGGRGRCRGCKVKVLQGAAPATDEDRRVLGEAELAEGWRLACRLRPEEDLVIELAQWDAPILSDDSALAFTPQDGLGVAVDLGSTTIVAQLLDLRTGCVLGVRTALNAQARHGADIMSRIEFAMSNSNTLTALVRGQIEGLIWELLAAAERPPDSLVRVVVVGNTVMHHLFCGVSVEPLAHTPFEPVDDGLKSFQAAALGWRVANASVHFLPCLGGFVGSDILAGIFATGLHASAAPQALLDLGANGEMVVSASGRLLCASTAAGPAFEGARISMGMRAATGAVSEVTLRDGALHCHVIGNAQPRGLCGSGLVDAVSAMLELSRILPSGRVAPGAALTIADPVRLTQSDVRELQLAKGAIAAGLDLLLDQAGVSPDALAQVHLAGAFGNYINRQSARRIGLLAHPLEKIRPAGNTALLGAKIALLHGPELASLCAPVVAATRHVPLHEDPRFQDVYAEHMGFPRSTNGQ